MATSKSLIGEGGAGLCFAVLTEATHSDIVDTRHFEDHVPDILVGSISSFNDNKVVWTTNLKRSVPKMVDHELLCAYEDIFHLKRAHASLSSSPSSSVSDSGSDTPTLSVGSTSPGTSSPTLKTPRLKLSLRLFDGRRASADTGAFKARRASVSSAVKRLFRRNSTAA